MHIDNVSKGAADKKAISPGLRSLIYADKIKNGKANLKWQSKPKDIVISLNRLNFIMTITA